ncbi:neprilysin-3-like [Ornithodoros turicata]|uniref:neprilysin-3-like n=1 Tax=Ornithodoros turicata TaxID=34597 RepID=UPI003139618E
MVANTRHTRHRGIRAADTRSPPTNYPSNAMLPICTCGVATGIALGAIVAGLVMHLAPPEEILDAFGVTPTPPNDISMLSFPTNVCFASSCVVMSRILQQTMNEYADPCDNFYGYVCGRYDVSTGNIQEVMEAHVKQLVTKAMATITVPSTGQTPVQKAMGLLQACHNVRAKSTTNQIDELQGFMKDHSITLTDNDTSDPTERLFELSLHYAVHTLYRTGLSPTAVNSYKKRLLLITFNIDHYEWLAERETKKNSATWKRKHYNDFLKAMNAGQIRIIEVAEDIVYGVLSKLTGAFNSFQLMTMKDIVGSSTWLPLLQKYASPGYTEQDDISVSTTALQYASQVSQLLGNVMLNQLVAWEVVRQLGPFVHYQMSNKFGTSFYGKCEERMKDVVSVGFFYFLDLLPRKALLHAVLLIREVKNNIMEWATASTVVMDRPATLKTLSNFKILVGFPDYLNTTSNMEELWNEIPDVGDRFLAFWLRMHKRWIEWQLNHPLSYLFDITNLRITRDSDRSILTVPASMLDGIFFESGAINSINYAGIGYSLGTALASIVDKTAPVNCPHEHINDLVGLHAAHSAFELASAREPVILPQLELSPQRIFFVSACLKTCSVRTRVDLLQSETCNGLARNSHAFASAFQCREGANMNPRRKCYLF